MSDMPLLERIERRRSRVSCFFWLRVMPPLRRTIGNRRGAVQQDGSS